MDVGAAISLGIGIAGFIAGILWKVVDLSVKFGKMQENVSRNGERDKEEREKFDTKFANIDTRFHEIDNELKNQGSGIAGLTASLNTLSAMCARTEAKIDRLTERMGGQ